MKICPICKNESKTVGPKVLWDTKQKGNMHGADSYKSIIMCEECNMRYKNGELRFKNKE